MSKSDKQDIILAELQALRKQVADLMSTQASSKPARKQAKPKDPNAPPKPPTDWNVFLGVVREALKGAGKPSGVHVMQYASHLKNTFSDAYSWDVKDIVAGYAAWDPPEPKPKADKPKVEGEAKPKRTLTPEHIAAMQEGKKRAAEARKHAEEASKAAEVEVVEDKPSKPMAKDANASALIPLPWKGKRMLMDKASNGVWLRNPDGSKGEWQGVLSADKKSLDNSVAEPNE
jgi:hypothetical protein